MKDLDSGIFYINAKEFEECDWHITRLSLNFNLDDSQTYFAGSKEYKISPDKFLLINEGQRFKTVASSDRYNRMVTIAFKVGLAQNIHKSLVLSNEGLLEAHEGVNSSLDFFERTYSLDAKLRSRVTSLIDPACEKEFINDQLECILETIIIDQHKLTRQAMEIKKVRPSTRIEIFKRLNWSLDYIHDNFSRNISVNELAKEACVSTFHFKRLFKEFFRQAPYQYIKKIRLEKSAELLKSGMPVYEVCRSVGWEDASSFVRLFKKEMNCTPHQYRSRAGTVHRF